MNNMACKIPDTALWRTEYTDILYNVRKTQKGVMPVKPFVHLSKELHLPPAKALCISG